MTDPATGQKLPPPDFAVLAQMLAGPAFVHLGLVVNPATGRTERDLDQAKWHVDLLHVLEEKTRGQLTQEERDLVDQLLHQLRQAYVALRG